MSSKFIAAMLAGVLTLSAQDRNFFPKPGYFRETLGSPNLHVELKPPTQIADFVVGGKLELSLRAYIELVMANNTDVALTRLNIDNAKNAILRGFGPVYTALWAMSKGELPWGAGHHRAFADLFDRTAGMVVISEDLPDPANCVTLDPDLKAY